MKYRKDIISLPREFPFSIFNAGRRICSEPVLHFHDCLEINYIEKGGGVNIIEGREYPLRPGDFYIINNLEHHFAFAEDGLLMKVIVFDPDLVLQRNPGNYDYIAPFYSRSIHFSNCIEAEDPLTGQLLSIIREIEEEWSYRQEGYRMVVRALLMKLLAILYRHFKSGQEMGDDVKAFHRSYDRIRDAISYIEEHYTDRITLNELAALSHMSRTYFSGYFKRVMGMNVSEYIQSLRIHTACSLLKTSDRTITNISALCGFNNITHFNKVFKKHLKQTPGQYRNGE